MTITLLKWYLLDFNNKTSTHTHTHICYTMHVLSFVLYVFHDSWCHCQFFLWVRVTHVFTGFCVVLLSVFTFWFYVVVSVTDFRIKTMFGSCLPLVVLGEIMSYLRYLCLFAHSGVQHILRCICVLFFFILCALCSQFWLPLRYSLYVYLLPSVSPLTPE